jgi:DNA repair exonuclease SbcCD ATPase subunit
MARWLGVGSTIYPPGVALPLLVDPRTLARALEDLHAIATAARELPAVERRLTERLESAEAELRTANEHARELVGAVARIDDVEREVAQLVRLAGELRDGLPALDEALRSIRTLEGATATLAAAAGPLQGTAERLGRIADRLPGGRRG